MTTRRIAMVVYEGVLADECDAFRSVLSLLPGAEFSTVASDRVPVSGPGGTQDVDARFVDIDDIDVVIVPGGLGCERAADDPELREFLIKMERLARYVAASSTGTVVVASAGLLHGEPAATHWLAGDLLRRYGSDTADRRLVVSGNIITCEGRLSAVDAAFALTERLAGSDMVDQIRSTLLERGRPHLREPALLERIGARLRPRSSARVAKSAHTPAGTPDNAPDVSGSDQAVTPLSVMIELVDNDELARRLKRSARRPTRRR